MTGIDVCKCTLTEVEAELVLRRYRRQRTYGLIHTFLFFAVLIGMLFYLLLNLFSIVTSPALAGFASGISAGLLALIGVLRSHVIQEESAAIRRDLQNAACEVILVRSRRAMPIDIPGMEPALALDCGEQIVLLCGSWWCSSSSRKLIHWSPRFSDYQLPTTEFSIKKLASSGFVVAVELSGNKLRVEDEQVLCAPLCSLPKYAECIYFDAPIGSLDVNQALSTSSDSD